MNNHFLQKGQLIYLQKGRKGRVKPRQTRWDSHWRMTLVGPVFFMTNPVKHSKPVLRWYIMHQSQYAASVELYLSLNLSEW